MAEGSFGIGDALMPPSPLGCQSEFCCFPFVLLKPLKVLLEILLVQSPSLCVPCSPACCDADTTRALAAEWGFLALSATFQSSLMICHLILQQGLFLSFKADSRSCDSVFRESLL